MCLSAQLNSMCRMSVRTACANRSLSNACRLRLEHLRLSTLRSPVGVTLIVAYDIARLHMLSGLCSSWGGHISAAVYLVRFVPSFAMQASKATSSVSFKMQCKTTENT